jgi:hypothetical protein
VEALNAPLVQFQSLLIAGFVKQLPSEAVAEIGAVAAPKPSLLWRGFLNSRSSVKGTHVSKMLIVLLTLLEVVEERENSSWNGLLQSQNWPVGFRPSVEIVVWDKDGHNLFPIDVCHPSKEIDEWDYFPDPLDWDYDEEEDPALALLDAIEEDFHKEVKVA